MYGKRSGYNKAMRGRGILSGAAARTGSLKKKE